MLTEAKWIWGGEEKSPRNEWRCFRKKFKLSDDGWSDGLLTITADSRYILYVNGTLVGRGPVRCWPFEQAYDTYNIGHLLRYDTENIVSVLVMHFGVSTYSYLRGRGGLLAQLELEKANRKKAVLFSTDTSWKTIRHTGQDSRVPRMSFQQAFAERVDASICDDGWTSNIYSDDEWEDAKVIGEAGMLPWTRLKARDIPFLAEEDIYPERVESLREIDAASVPWTAVMETRNQMIPGSEDHANAFGYIGYIATLIRVSRSTEAVFGITYWAPNIRSISLNGKRYTRDQLESGIYLHLDLHEGDNLLMVELAGLDHGRGLYIGLQCEADYQFISPLSAGTEYAAFVSIGPFETYEYIDHRFDEEMVQKQQNVTAYIRGDLQASDINEDEKEKLEQYRQIAFLKSKEELLLYKNWLRPLPWKLISKESVIALSVWKKRAAAHPVPRSLDQIASACSCPAIIPSFDHADTELVIDLGQEVSGYLSFDIDADEGTIIDFYGFEFMYDGWIQHMHYLENSIRYICREGRQRYTSPIRRGLRYLMITVRKAGRPVLFHDVHMISSHYPVAKIGQFTCSDALLNDIWKISQNTTILCMEDTFVDCPAFEQTFWVGDSRNEALIAYYLFGSEDLIKRCLNLVPGSKTQSPLYVDQVPSGFNSVIPNWTFFWVNACLEYYRRTGDLSFVKDIYPEIRFTLKHYQEYIDDRGLLNMHGWNFLDWAPIDQPREGVVSHQNMLFVKAMRHAAELAEITGSTGEAAQFYEVAESLAQAINRYLWSDEREAYYDCIHADGTYSTVFSMQTQIVACLCGIASPARKKKLEDYLLSPPSGFIPVGSPFMSFFYYEALANAGYFAQMINDMRKQYGQMLEYGATTCWEMYPKPVQGRIDAKHLTRSHCHAWSAAPGYFLGAYVLGVSSDDPGWKKVKVCPNPSGLSWAKGSVPLPEKGRIDVSWRIDDKHGLLVDVWAPQHVSIDASLPGNRKGQIKIHPLE
ncbi:family 78 glycoside hydrolase catalytic domain [Bacillaceae bacterium Marseille-Q3522]|nr:family 78 glycoside hydrolase catalytic domain [Bacillaceae bacterium Marseille-Q3522]